MQVWEHLLQDASVPQPSCYCSVPPGSSPYSSPYSVSSSSPALEDHGPESSVRELKKVSELLLHLCHFPHISENESLRTWPFIHLCFYIHNSSILRCIVLWHLTLLVLEWWWSVMKKSYCSTVLHLVLGQSSRDIYSLTRTSVWESAGTVHTTPLRTWTLCVVLSH